MVGTGHHETSGGRADAPPTRGEFRSGEPDAWTPARHSPLPVAITVDDVHRIAFANAAFNGVSDSPGQPLTGRTIADALSAPGTLTQLLDRAFESGGVNAELVTWTDPTGRLRRYTAVATPLLSTGPRISGLMVTLAPIGEQACTHDVTGDLRLANQALVVAGIREHELAENARRKAEELNAVLANLNEGVVVIDVARGHTVITPVAGRLLGLPADLESHEAIDAIRRCAFQRLDGTAVPFDQGAVARALRGDSFSDHELVLVRGDGQRVHLQFSGSAVRGASGQVAVALNVFRDVTKLRELEYTRQQHVSLISHDLRGPLAAAKMAAQMLARVSQPTKLTGRIVESMDRADRMLRDLLDAYRIRAGQGLVLRLAQCDLSDVAMEVADELVALWGDRFHLEIAPGVCGVWSAEELRRVIWNLASNAVKYGDPDAPITIKLQPKPDGPELCVHNHGPGIPPSELSRLFDPYARSGAGAVGAPRGWGLGLTLVQGSVHAHGGKVRVRSEPGQGTTFTVVLPWDSTPFQAATST